MDSDRSKAKNNQLLLAWRVFFALAISQSLLVLGLLTRETSAGQRFLIGFSFSRLAIIGLVLVVLAAFIALLLMSWSRPDWTQRQIRKAQSLPERQKTFASILLVSGLVMLGGVYSITLTPEISEPFTATLFQRLIPLIVWLTGLSAQILLFLFLLRRASTEHVNHHGYPSRFREEWVFWVALIIFSMFFVLWGWVIRNTMQNESVITGWNDLGVPILETQVLIAWLAGLVAWVVLALGRRSAGRVSWLYKLKPLHLDLILFFALWVGTILLWNSIPAPPSYFLSVTRAPNYEAYPNSDALAYDMSAQVLMVGQGLRFVNDIYIRRPILALFFTILHVLGRQNTAAVIFWQIVFLALAPAFVYLLGKLLHNRMAGVIGGVLIALRGATAITVASAITSSHVKLMMADLPAMLAMIMFIVCVVRWLQTRSQFLGFLSGGLLGIAILIRPELGAAIFAVGLISFMVYRASLRQWLGSGLLFSLGAFLILAPWIFRNWSLTGQIFLDTPTFRTEVLQERYQTQVQPAPSPTETSRAQPGAAYPTPEGPIATPAGMEGAPSTNQGGFIAIIRDNSSSVAGFVTSHFLNSQLQIFLTLPTTFRPLDSTVAFWGHHSLKKYWEECCSSVNYLRRMPYWRKWYGNIPSQAIIPIAINLILIALGLQQSWKRNRWIGMFPVTVGFFHLMLNALARNSGGRYILSVDWIVIVYFSVGLSQASVWLVNQFKTVESNPAISYAVVDVDHRTGLSVFRMPAFYVLACLLFLIGSAAPILEKAIQPRYPDSIQAQMLNNLLDSSALSAQQKEALVNLLNNNGWAIAGRALYPRFYKAGQGEPGTPDPLESQPYPRLGFYLVNRNFQPIILPLTTTPEEFPNGADVLVIGCPDGQAVAVALFDSPGAPPGAILFRSGMENSLVCAPQ